MSTPLAIVDFVLRRQPDAGALHQLARTISSYLGPSPSLYLSQACYFGSLQLLDWIWDCSCTSTAHRTSTWSLSNFLRSDLHYSRYQFAQSMMVAANRGDWEMVKWLFAHFSDGQVPWEVAAAAAWSGNLPMLQFLLVNDAGRRDVEEGGGQKKREVEAMEREIQSETVSEGNPRGGGEHVVTWGPWVMASAKRGKHSTIVQWLNEYVLGEEEDEQGKDKKREIVAALEDGDDALAKALMPPGRCVLDYAAQCSRLDLIEMMLECGYIRRDRGCANSAIRRLAVTGRLDLMQQIACANGYLAMLQWLMEHPLGQILRDDMRQQRRFTDLVYAAGYDGHTDVIQAVRDGHYDTTKWLVEHVRFPERDRPVDYIIEIAATWGRFDILKLLHEMALVGMSDLTETEQKQSDQAAVRLGS
ncbi:hypothetical protein PRIC2_007813 [Phytophthora ramorum]